MNLRNTGLHAVILVFAVLTMVPLAFVVNNSFRSTLELDHAFFGWPQSFKNAAALVGPALSGSSEPVTVRDNTGETRRLSAAAALRFYVADAFDGYVRAWRVLRRYMLNSLLVCSTVALGAVLLASVTAYVLSRYRFPGSRFIFYYIISTMMFPAVLTLVPSFMLVKYLGLLNSHWALILPWIAGSQVFAIFVFKGFFDGLPEELFESARLDGAGHLQCYRHIVLPLSKPILAVVAVMTILGTWNNFLWPFITNTEGKYHVIASGLYVLAASPYSQNPNTLYAAYLISSVPLLLLFVYATKPFIQGVTSGAFKA